MAITPYHKPVSGQPVDTYAPINWDFINQSLQQKDVAVDSALAKGQEIQGILAGLESIDIVNANAPLQARLEYNQKLREMSAAGSAELQQAHEEFSRTGDINKMNRAVQDIRNKYSSGNVGQYVKIGQDVTEISSIIASKPANQENEANKLNQYLYNRYVAEGYTPHVPGYVPSQSAFERTDKVLSDIYNHIKGYNTDELKKAIWTDNNAANLKSVYGINDPNLTWYRTLTTTKNNDITPERIMNGVTNKLAENKEGIFNNYLYKRFQQATNMGIEIPIESIGDFQQQVAFDFNKPLVFVKDEEGNDVLDREKSGYFAKLAYDTTDEAINAYKKTSVSFSTGEAKDRVPIDKDGTGGKEAGISAFITDITPEIPEGDIVPKTTETINKITDLSTQARTKGTDAPATKGAVANLVHGLQNTNYALFNHKGDPDKPSVGVQALTEGLELVLNPEYESLWGRYTKDPMGYVNLNKLNKSGEKVINGLMTVMHYDTTSKSYNYYGFLKELGDIANKSKSGLHVLTEAPLIKKAIERGFLKKEDIVAGVENITKVYKDTVLNEFRNLPDNRTDLQASISKINKTFTDMVTEAEYGLVNSKDPNNVKLAQEEQNKGVAITIANKPILRRFMDEGNEFTAHLIGDRIELFRLEYDKDTKENKRVDILKVDPKSSFADNEEVRALKKGFQDSKQEILTDPVLTQLAAFVFDPEEYSALFKAGNQAKKGINTTVYFGNTVTETEKFKVKVSSIKKDNITTVPVYTVIVNGIEKKMSLDEIFRLSLSYDGFE